MRCYSIVQPNATAAVPGTEGLLWRPQGLEWPASRYVSGNGGVPDVLRTQAVEA